MSSKGVGIVRRMDELGRVVIPKEVRKSFHIGTNEPLEIFVDGEDTVVLRKYHSGPDMEALSQEYAETLFKTFGQPVLVDDSQNIIAVAGLPKKEYLSKPIPENLILQGKDGTADLSPSEEFPFAQALIEPVHFPQGPTGRFVMLFRKPGDPKDAERKTLQTASSFLSRWTGRKSASRPAQQHETT